MTLEWNLKTESKRVQKCNHRADIFIMTRPCLDRFISMFAWLKLWNFHLSQFVQGTCPWSDYHVRAMSSPSQFKDIMDIIDLMSLPCQIDSNQPFREVSWYKYWDAENLKENDHWHQWQSWNMTWLCHGPHVPLDSFFNEANSHPASSNCKHW